ncbi:hypothetical protein [Bradyrhizobium sp. URHD0069]|uniref:hypothetical protein n=1 Tax=Bradyrhizobium sp. URHD0069 TaxID=1380355 RepID=UPI000496E059|nr:hypothetical protein [Bradyrhizobium sp. URHD0069]
MVASRHELRLTVERGIGKHNQRNENFSTFAFTEHFHVERNGLVRYSFSNFVRIVFELGEFFTLRQTAIEDLG